MRGVYQLTFWPSKHQTPNTTSPLAALHDRSRRSHFATMAIISANAMIRSLALFHLTLAALLVKNPKLIANQSVVLILGGSMQLVSNSFSWQ